MLSSHLPFSNCSKHELMFGSSNLEIFQKLHQSEIIHPCLVCLQERFNEQDASKTRTLSFMF